MSRFETLGISFWNGRVSPVLDVARHLLRVSFEKDGTPCRQVESLPGGEIEQQADRIAELGVEVLICGAVSCELDEILHRCGITVIGFTAGPVEEVLAAWSAGRLPDARYAMPGCCGRRRGCRRRGRGRRYES